MKREKIPNWLRRAVIEKCGTKCFYCGKEGFIDKSRPGFPNILEKKTYKYWLTCADNAYILKHKTMHIDHIIPISRGGKTELNNLVVACGSCNENKRAKTPKEWEKVKLKNKEQIK